MTDDQRGEVLFEFTKIGAIVRVAAIDAQTGVEAIIQGPATLSQLALQRTALDKLRYVLEKKRKAGELP